MPRKKLKHNPKLEKPDDKRKKSSYQRTIDPYEERRNYSHFYMALVFVGVVSVIAILVFVVFTQSGTRIQQYDLVRIDYEIYDLNDYYNHGSPTIKETNTWLNVCSRYDTECEGGLIKGFYNKLLGKRVGDMLNFEVIEKCRDDDWDGYDDAYPGTPALSYGNSSDLLYNTDIVLWFKIHEINVSSSTETQTQVSCESKELHRSENYNLFNYVLVKKKEERDFFL